MYHGGIVCIYLIGLIIKFWGEGGRRVNCGPSKNSR